MADFSGWPTVLPGRLTVESGSAPTAVPPSPDLLAITRLYLEKYELLAEEDRAIYRKVLWMIASPVLVAGEVKEKEPSPDA
jgi:hypothetical protein